MNVLPKSSYRTKYSTYAPSLNSGYTNATFYKSVSVDDIIEVEGKRKEIRIYFGIKFFV